MQSKSSRRAAVAIGVIMIASMVAAPIMGLLQQATTSTTQADTTPVPTATPIPVPDINTLVLENSYLHPTSLFSIDYPTGWQPGTPSQSSTIARIGFSNSEVMNDIDVYIEVPETPVTTADEIDARYTTTVLQNTLSTYGTPVETGRRQEEDRLIVDFEITRASVTRLARQISWSDGEWIYSVRVIAPTNARDVLLYLLDAIMPTIQPHKEFATVPVSWQAYFDTQDKHLIRYPSGWLLTDGAPGLPASFSSSGGQTVARIETEAGSVTSEAEATAWLNAYRSDAEVLSIVPVERGSASGFSVAYTFRNVDGDPLSGLAVLLNGDDDKLHVANLHFQGQGIDLNALDDPSSAYSTLAEAMGTFTLAPELAPTTAEPAG